MKGGSASSLLEMNMTTVNPFFRGYSDFQINRLMVIDYGSEFPLAYRALHESQEHLQDHYIIGDACVFNDDYAYTLDDGKDVERMQEECEASGQIRSVVWSVQANKDGQLVHIGDYHTREEANEVANSLQFENGHFSRCWEISNAHVTEEAYTYLIEKSGSDLPFIEAFVLGNTSVGVKLVCTPWTDKHLRDIVGYGNVSALREEFVRLNMPDSLINVLFLAAVADTRVLILDSDAPTLRNLPVYDW